MSKAGAAAGSGRADGRRSWLARRTLRGRLIAGLLALLAVACAAVGAVTYVSLHGYLLGQLDQQLVQASMRYQACLGGHPPGADSDGDNQPGPPPHSAYNCAQQQQEQTFTAQIKHGVLTDNHISYGICPLSHTDKAVLTAYPAAGSRSPATCPASATTGCWRCRTRRNPASPTSPACR